MISLSKMIDVISLSIAALQFKFCRHEIQRIMKYIQGKGIPMHKIDSSFILHSE